MLGVFVIDGFPINCLVTDGLNGACGYAEVFGYVFGRKRIFPDRGNLFLG